MIKQRVLAIPILLIAFTTLAGASFPQLQLLSYKSSIQSGPTPLSPSVTIPRWFSVSDGREFQAGVYWWWADWAEPATQNALALNSSYYAMSVNEAYQYENTGGVRASALDSSYNVDIQNHLWDSGDTCISLYGTPTHAWNMSNPKFVQCIQDQIVQEETAYTPILGYNITGLVSPGGGLMNETVYGFYAPPIIKGPVETRPGNWTYWQMGNNFAVNVYLNQGYNTHLFDPYSSQTLAQQEEAFTNVVNAGTLFVAGVDNPLTDANSLTAFQNWIYSRYHNQVKFWTTSELAYFYYSYWSSNFSWSYDNTQGVYTVTLNLDRDIYFLPLKLAGIVYSVKIDGQDYPSFSDNFIVLGSLSRGSHTIEAKISDSGNTLYPHLVGQQYYHPIPTRLRHISWTNNSTLSLSVTQDRVGKPANLTFLTAGRQIEQVTVDGTASSYILNGDKLTVPIRFTSPKNAQNVEISFTTNSISQPSLLTNLSTGLLVLAVSAVTFTVVVLAYRRALRARKVSPMLVEQVIQPDPHNH